MAKSLSELKKQSSSVLSKLKAKNEESSSKDSRIWTPSYDKERGTGYAIIRFLPAPQGEEFPYVTIYNHSITGQSGKKYYENSLTTLKQKDPVSEMNSALWNSGVESDKDVARKFKRKTNHYANILVIDDPVHPENNGKVMIYRYGAMIQKLLNEKMFPEFETDTALNPFCPWEGANFEIRIKTVKLGKDIVPNYEKSFFNKPSTIGSDEEIEAVWGKCYSLTEFLDVKNFKTYEELKRRLVEVLGHTVGSGVSVTGDLVEAPRETRQPQPRAKSAPVQRDEDETPPFDVDEVVNKKSNKAADVDDEDLAFFNSL